MPEKQPRILLFVHDASGLGHLRRSARIAATMQATAATLVVTGIREVAWMLPLPCEFLHLPSWDGLRPGRAAYWGPNLWMRVPKPDALKLRQELLAAAFRAFDPDAVLVDYLPFGQGDELRECLAMTRARKYFILRGIVDKSDRDILYGAKARAIADTFDRILITCDARVVDVTREYDFDAATTSKVTYVGYVGPSHVDRHSIRESAGIPRDALWIVCSGGSGTQAEPLLRACIECSSGMPHVYFDVVLGPRSTDNPSAFLPPANCRLHRERHDLAAMHGAADIVVTTGGYNSVLEAATGGARILVCSMKTEKDDEQRVQAARLARFYPVRAAVNPGEIDRHLHEMAREASKSYRPTLELCTEGAMNIYGRVMEDLSGCTAPGSLGGQHACC